MCASVFGASCRMKRSDGNFLIIRTNASGTRAWVSETKVRLHVHTRDDKNANMCRQPLGGRIEKSNPNPKPNKYYNDDIRLKLSCNGRFLRACVYTCARVL